MRRFIIDKMPPFFLHPPHILATYHYWRCPGRTRSWSLLLDQGRNAERRWATTLSLATRYSTDVSHSVAALCCKSVDTTYYEVRRAPSWKYCVVHTFLRLKYCQRMCSIHLQDCLITHTGERSIHRDASQKFEPSLAGPCVRPSTIAKPGVVITVL